MKHIPQSTSENDFPYFRVTLSTLKITQLCGPLLELTWAGIYCHVHLFNLGSDFFKFKMNCSYTKNGTKQ